MRTVRSWWYCITCPSAGLTTASGDRHVRLGHGVVHRAADPGWVR